MRLMPESLAPGLYRLHSARLWRHTELVIVTDGQWRYVVPRIAWEAGRVDWN